MKANLSAEMGARIALWIGILGIAAGVCFIALIPKPSTALVYAKQKAQEQKILAQSAKAQKDYDNLHKTLVTRTWSGGAQNVGPGALQAMNALATKYRVKLSGFRPERTTQASSLNLLPYSVTATGGYTDVLGFVKAIENPDNKLAVDSIQIASSEANTDQVIATIGITAYQVSDEAKHV